MSTDTIPAPSTRNILRVFRQIPAAEVAEGREWYPQARELAEDLARLTTSRYDEEWEHEVAKAAAVIAVLSPRLSWKKNVELAMRAYNAHLAEANGATLAVTHAIETWTGLKINARKAFRILDGEDMDEVVKGPKVRQFWHTIVDPTDPRAVVVDRHAFDVAVNRVLTDLVRGKLLGKAGAYDNVADKYRRAAAIISRELAKAAMTGPNSGSVTPDSVTITPAELQAITWVWWRTNRAAANHG